MVDRNDGEGIQLPGLDTAYPVSDDQVTSLHQRGWTRLAGLLDRVVVDTLRDGLAVTTAPHRATVAGLNPNVKNSNFNHEAPAWHDPVFMRVATSRRLASAVVALMKQPEAVLAQDISFFKLPGSGPTNPHQDYSYYPSDRKGTLTLWIALVDMTPEMGPLYYLEGSNLEGPLGFHDGLDIRLQYPHLYDSRIVAGENLAAGDAQVHWDLTIHGAAPNTTDVAREAYVARYVRTDAVYTGLPHPHFNNFGLKSGVRFAQAGVFPKIDGNGLIPEESAGIDA